MRASIVRREVWNSKGNRLAFAPAFVQSGTMNTFMTLIFGTETGTSKIKNWITIESGGDIEIGNGTRVEKGCKRGIGIKSVTESRLTSIDTKDGGIHSTLKLTELRLLTVRMSRPQERTVQAFSRAMKTFADTTRAPTACRFGESYYGNWTKGFLFLTVPLQIHITGPDLDLRVTRTMTVASNEITLEIVINKFISTLPPIPNADSPREEWARNSSSFRTKRPRAWSRQHDGGSRHRAALDDDRASTDVHRGQNDTDLIPYLSYRHTIARDSVKIFGANANLVNKLNTLVEYASPIEAINVINFSRTTTKTYFYPYRACMLGQILFDQTSTRCKVREHSIACLVYFYFDAPQSVMSPRNSLITGIPLIVHQSSTVPGRKLPTKSMVVERQPSRW
ncbi:hypothetical protein EVAR_75957_1 [Eumeta japonica]|uniref:Uncharacterized protein n=1 Tax=Eumeta variegata TaxID=151549 RepID=A0A4C1UW70_EUMVA|nr:hypothetical protein EVAR_75957_1 [Eumeta japonica]